MKDVYIPSGLTRHVRKIVEKQIKRYDPARSNKCSISKRECPQCGRFVTGRVCITDAEAQGCIGWKL